MLLTIQSLSSNHHLGLKWALNLELLPLLHASSVVVATGTLLHHGGNDNDVKSISQTKKPLNLTIDKRTLYMSPSIILSLSLSLE